MECSGSRDEDKQSPLSQPQQPHRKEKEPDKGPDHLRTDILTVGKHMRRWKIVRKIGSGGFGQIYQGLDLATNKDVAIKVESKQCPNQLLKMEVTVLNAVQGKDHICQYVACGKTKTFSFLVMSLQGKNLGELRREVPSGTLTIETILRITRQIILSIKTVHKAGFLHRDIKPSNFTIGNTPETKKTVYILDFGLARPYTNGKGEVRKARSNAGFRGTARYASINAHHSKELSRRDDLWSMFYMIVEFRLGTLPWKKIKNKEEIVTVKENCDPNDFFRFLPREFEQIYNHIKSLQYEDEPDYDLLISLIDQSIKRKNVDLNAPFDWERMNDTPTTRRKRAAKNHSADSTPW
ncbi:uncharacterized protein TRIADDRAFT_32197 [Trichoplax adhaerens]|uniref:non-specific serine/threonine protein kinase n=1 Tax=Trichoplax adhaerens TaxID=10228 RepID=B3SAC2_TRIAD|nr:hypothetical protein TRIADDRAFT_32197 [Trichoplax adhaerens]EDV20287.1 hypothetical protein TRIADDRAFT_32197 [Trichoplax adhaerens]|eukprot:XP_002117237.1 hypothetical protein TRIADDRAFT_32197 [Trichoplax adhaerens]